MTDLTPDVQATRDKDRSTRLTAELRIGQERALEAVPSSDAAFWLPDDSEFSDAPVADDLPEQYLFDEDRPDFDPERELPVPRVRYQRSPRLSIYVGGDQLLHHRVHLPDLGDAVHDDALVHLRATWSKVAGALIDSFDDALRCRTPLAALKRLGTPMAWKQVSTMDPDRPGRVLRDSNQRVVKDESLVAGKKALGSESLISRNRLVAVQAPFGVVPLWFFSEGRSDALLDDLEALGAALAREPSGRAVTCKWVETVLSRMPARSSAIQPDSLRRTHGAALTAVIAQPEVVARHRSQWPTTTPSALLGDLGIGGGASQERSHPVATLALVGAFL